MATTKKTAGESTRKVLLIGLGGTGCAVVSAVKNRVGNRDRSIQFLGFDTDSNRELSGDLTVVRTAREASVTEMLMQMTDHRPEWFPDSPLLLERNMLRGAGQVRVLSRLAFADLLLENRGGIPELDRAIEQLRSEEGNANDGIKIMIVSSFAGGTGAGMFLQMPLYLRQHIKRKFPRVPIMIRGLFALPDVFMGHELNEVQRESMYANAYACLKELSAINNICLSKDDSMSQYDLKIDDLFDSRSILAKARKAKEEKRLSEIPTAGRKPYDFIFFVDSINSNNNTIGGSPETYIEQMADITYMQVYSPMANTTDSREDNLILTKMMSNGKSMYGSAASTLMEYPYEDILTYFTSKATKEMISKRWRYIDTQYEKRKEDADRKRRFDSNVPKLERSEVFISEVNDLINAKRKDFVFLKEAAFESTKDNRLKCKSAMFISSLDMTIEQTMEEDGPLKKKKYRCDTFTLKANKDATSDTIAEMISNAEEALSQYQETIEERTQSLYHIVAEKFVPDSLDSPYAQNPGVYNIFSMLRMRNDEGRDYGIHPLAARFLLYSLIEDLQKKRGAARSKAMSFSDEIHNYYNDKDEEKPGIQGWVDQVPQMRKRLLRRSNADAIQYLNKYRDEEDGFNAQLSNLKEYCKFRLSEAVYEELIKRLQTISAQFEKMFQSIGQIEDDIEETLKSLNRKFTRKNASTTYLCASPAYLEKTYQRSGISIDEDQSNSLFETILQTMYKEAMSELRLSEERVMLSDKEIELIEKRMVSSVKKLFRESILPQNREKIRHNTVGLLDISAYEALKKEVDFRLEEKALAEGRGDEITEQEQETERQNFLMEVYRKTAPYLTYNRYHVPDPNNQNDTGAALSTEPHYWGINAEVYAEMKREQEDVEAYMSPAGTKRAEISRSDMYSKYEIQCYRGLYGVQLTEIPKFRESNDEELQGEFYKNYCSRIRSMVLCQYGSVEEGVTPHLDIRWHNRQYLPMIDNSHEMAGGIDAARAMWLGLAYHNQCIKEEQNGKTGQMDAWAHFPESRGDGLVSGEKYGKRPLVYNGKRIRRNDFYELYQAFTQDSVITEQMLDVTKALFETDCASAMRVSEIRLYGFGSVSFTAALIGNTRSDAPVEDDDEEIVNEAFNTNALEIAGRIMKDRRATAQDRELIMKALIDLIDEFADKAGLPNERREDFCGLIFIHSPFIQKKNRKGAEDALIPPFAAIMQKYDRKYNKPNDNAVKGKTPRTAEKAGGKTVTSAKPTTKKTAAPKPASSAKKQSTAPKANATTNRTASTATKAASKTSAAKKTTKTNK